MTAAGPDLIPALPADWLVPCQRVGGRHYTTLAVVSLAGVRATRARPAVERGRPAGAGSGDWGSGHGGALTRLSAADGVFQ